MGGGGISAKFVVVWDLALLLPQPRNIDGLDEVAVRLRASKKASDSVQGLYSKVLGLTDLSRPDGRTVREKEVAMLIHRTGRENFPPRSMQWAYGPTFNQFASTPLRPLGPCPHKSQARGTPNLPENSKAPAPSQVGGGPALSKRALAVAKEAQSP